MHVQRVVVPGNQAESWTVLDDDGRVVEPAERWLAHLTAIERSPNTVKAYSHDLKDYLVFLASRGLDWREVRLEDIGAFVAWLRLPAEGRDGSVAVLPSVAPKVTESTVNRKLSAINAFYCFHARHGVDVGELLVTWQAPGRGGGRGGYRPFLHLLSALFPCREFWLNPLVCGGLRFARAGVVSLRSALMLMSFFSSRGWESWDLEHRPLIPERMPVLIDDDLLFEDGPGARRPIVAVNRWLRELPVSGAPAPSTWETYARIVREWMEFLADRGVGVFASRERLRVALSGYAEHRATGPAGRRFAASTWNQHVSVLASFYRWAMAEGHAVAEPFSYRAAQTVFAGIARTVRVNQASRRCPKPHVTVRYLEPDFTAMFLNGLAGLGPDGAVDRLFHGRELARNACVGGAGGGDRPAVAGVHLPAGLRGARVAVVADGGADCVPGADGGDQGPEVRNHLDLLRCARGRAAVPAAGPRRHRGGFGPVTAARVGRAAAGDRR